MKPPTIFTLHGLFLLSLLMGGLALAQSKSGLPAGQAAGTFELKVSQGYFSLEANQAPLVQIFQEIGKQAEITFDSNIGPEEKVTVHLDRVSLEDGVKQLAKNVTVFYTENLKDKSRRLSRVVVLSEGKESAPVQTRTFTQPERVKEPAPQSAKVTKPEQQPEPFKFEFDPGKFTQKEQPRKQP